VTALSSAFADAGRPLLIGYLPAGFPTIAGSIEAITAMVEAGVDIVEIGLPYSDPLMDGPVIQDAVDVALRGGVRVRDIFRVVEAVAATGAPTLVMTYWNPVEQYGVDTFARDLAAAGGAGMITPDLLPDEAGPWLDASAAEQLDRVFLVAPSSPEPRLRAVAEASSGFIYVASTMGVTGARTATSSAAPALVARTREVTSLPLCVGLGVSNGDQAAEVGEFADGVIVGSALVRALAADGVAGVSALAADLATGVRPQTP
jgi:tryptophan synthase alpha chain